MQILYHERRVAKRSFTLAFPAARLLAGNGV